MFEKGVGTLSSMDRYSPFFPLPKSLVIPYPSFKHTPYYILIIIYIL